MVMTTTPTTPDNTKSNNDNTINGHSGHGRSVIMPLTSGQQQQSSSSSSFLLSTRTLTEICWSIVIVGLFISISLQFKASNVLHHQKRLLLQEQQNPTSNQNLHHQVVPPPPPASSFSSSLSESSAKTRLALQKHHRKHQQQQDEVLISSSQKLNNKIEKRRSKDQDDDDTQQQQQQQPKSRPHPPPLNPQQQQQHRQRRRRRRGHGHGHHNHHHHSQRHEPPPRPSYYELRREIIKQLNATETAARIAMIAAAKSDAGRKGGNSTKPIQLPPQKHSQSSYDRATVVHDAPWYTTTTAALSSSPKKRKRKLCKETCCVETVAISLKQDVTKPINTGDGRDLADLRLETFEHRGNVQYVATHLHPDLLPCLLPNTILFIENHEKALQYFWYSIRPHIHVPYTLVVSGSDFDTPNWSTKYMLDPLLTKLFGTNPRPPQLAEEVKYFYKYQEMGVGFSRVVPQERYLEPYLQITNYTNPFANKQKWDLQRQPLNWKTDVFVRFGLNRNGRKRMWNILCPNTTTPTTGIHNSTSTTTTTSRILSSSSSSSPTSFSSSSCNADTSQRIPVYDLYLDMSRFRFGISPQGKGFDCYRTYEMLMLGIIPIIHERPKGGRKLFEGLPVIHMWNMEKATTQQDFINAIVNYIQSEEFQKSSFDDGWKKLFIKYRRDQILRDTKRNEEIVMDDEGNRYYQAYKYSMKDATGNQQQKETFCLNKGKCEVPKERLQYPAPWLKNPTPPLSQKDQEWLEAWEKGGL